MERRRARSRGRQLRQLRASATAQLTFLTILTALICVLHVAWPDIFAVSFLVIVLMVGGFMMRTRGLKLLLGVVAAGLLMMIQLLGGQAVVSDLLVLVLAGVLMYGFARSREKLGLQGLDGEVMLIDLRDRLRAQGTIPRLPEGWEVQTTLKPAYGDSFSGDFLVSSLDDDDRILRLALVDVSGKGQAAGTRSLLLSGAFGGLIGASQVPFLASANDYLLNQRWEEGFATAVHFRLDLQDGTFEVARAGHPPAVQYHRGTGTWEVLRAGIGMALGLLPDEHYDVQPGVLAPGDALILYTDGIIERPGVDVDLGIDHLLGQAQRLVQMGFPESGSDWLVEAATDDAGDDRAIVLVVRR